MATEQPITVIGRLVADPEVRFVPSGGGVANFTIAFTPQRFDRNTSEWKDGTPTYWRCAAWSQGKLQRAENIGDMLKKGDAVIAQGVLETRKWEDKEGNERSSIELNVKAIGKDLTYHGQTYAASQPAADPWATPTANTGGWGSEPMDAPPF